MNAASPGRSAMLYLECGWSLLMHVAGRACGWAYENFTHLSLLVWSLQAAPKATASRREPPTAVPATRALSAPGRGRFRQALERELAGAAPVPRQRRRQARNRPPNAVSAEQRRAVTRPWSEFERASLGRNNSAGKLRTFARLLTDGSDGGRPYVTR